MLNFFYNKLNENIEKTIELCESPIEIEMLLKIIDYVLINSINYNPSIDDDFCYNLSFIHEINFSKIRIYEGNKSEVELKDPEKDGLELIYHGIRIDYSGFYEKEFNRYIEIIPQKKFNYYVDDETYGIPIVQKEFRLDFGVFLKDYKTDEVIKKFCIECDGYEYHSKQDRMIRDNERTRKLLTEGNYHTIRYLGREINEMKSKEIKSLLDILFEEKNKDFDYNTRNKGLEYSIDKNGNKWYKPKENKK
jgi:hypothetical protein